MIEGHILVTFDNACSIQNIKTSHVFPCDVLNSDPVSLSLNNLLFRKLWFWLSASTGHNDELNILIGML